MRTALLIAFNCIVVSAFCQDADSLAVAREVDSLLAKTKNLAAAQEYKAAAKTILEVHAIMHAAAVLDTLKLANIILQGTNYFQWAQMLHEGDSMLREAVALRKAKFGENHRLYAVALYSEANFLRGFERYETADSLFRRALAICKNIPDKKQTAYSLILGAMGHMYKEWGRNKEAEEFLLENATFIKETYLRESQQYCSAFTSLALFYMNTGRYLEAESHYNELLVLETKLFGEDSPGILGIRLVLARCLNSMGRINEAILILEKPLELARNNPKVKRFGYAILLGDFSSHLLAKGDLEKAERVLLEARSIFEQEQNGLMNNSYGVVLSNLGSFYQTVGRYQDASPLLKKARSVFEASYEIKMAKAHYLGINSIILGENYQALGNQDSAQWYMTDALQHLELRGKEHPDYVTGLIKFGEFYLYVRRFDKAREQFLLAKNTLENAGLTSSTLYANTLEGLAEVSVHEGNLPQALSIFSKAREILGTALGKNHARYAGTLSSLGSVYWRLNQKAEAVAAYDSATTIYKSNLLRSIRFLSERELNNGIQTLEILSNTVYSCAISGGNLPLLRPLAADNALFLKGRLLETRLALEKNLSEAPDSIRLIYNRWKGAHNLLAAEYSKPAGERQNVEIFEEQANSLEKTLTRSAAVSFSEQPITTWADVKKRLQPTDAAVEFVNFRFRSPDPTDSIFYAAILIKPGDTQPRFIPLFEEKSLDSLLQRNTDRNEGYVKHLYSLAERGATPLGKPQRSLYELLWKPLEKELAGVQTIYFSPSGLLHRINLAAIPINLDSVLGDRYRLVELGSTRQLVVPEPIKSVTNNAVLFGSIQYDSDSAAITHANAALDSASIATRGALSFAYTDSTLRIGTWSSLPFTDREVTNVESILKTAGIHPETRRGYAANEESFKSIGINGNSSPRILHLATHGFFFPDPELNPQSVIRNPQFDEPVFKISDHPMIRSGLLLAGANHAWNTGKPLKPGLEDGILTAYEISQMNLSNTELVVLSACETGLGDIQGNEGVYGLQRAFKIAGAKYLIMSFWQVPDKQTSLLMITFYKKWLEEKMAIPDAFRAAQKELREAGLDPYQWAGFVLVE